MSLSRAIDAMEGKKIAPKFLIAVLRIVLTSRSRCPPLTFVLPVV